MAAGKEKAGAGRRSGRNKGRRKSGKEEEESEGICDSEEESEEDDEEEEEVRTDENENAFRRGCGNPSRLEHVDNRFPLDDLRRSFRADR